MPALIDARYRAENDMLVLAESERSCRQAAAVRKEQEPPDSEVLHKARTSYQANAPP